MTESQTLRLRIVEEINRLPDDKLQKASDFFVARTSPVSQLQPAPGVNEKLHGYSPYNSSSRFADKEP